MANNTYGLNWGEYEIDEIELLNDEVICFMTPGDIVNVYNFGLNGNLTVTLMNVDDDIMFTVTNEDGKEIYKSTVYTTFEGGPIENDLRKVWYMDTKIKNLRWENTGGHIYIFYGSVRELGFCIDIFGEGAWYAHDYDDSLNWKGDEYTGGMDDKFLRYLEPSEALDLLSEIAKSDIPAFLRDDINTTLEEMK